MRFYPLPVSDIGNKHKKQSRITDFDSRYLVQKIILLFIILFIGCLYSATYYIDINGTMEYTSIQEAINNASDGDSLIVYPGVYFENIDYTGKTLFIGSLFLTTGTDSFINQTIIDGNQ